MITAVECFALRTYADLSCTPLTPSPSNTRTDTEEMQKDQAPQVPPRIRTPQTQENTQQSTQPEPAVPKIVSQSLCESNKWCKQHILLFKMNFSLYATS